MSDESLNIKDPHAWPVAASILLLFITMFNAIAGFIIAGLGFTAALIYYYRAKKKQRRTEKNEEKD